MKKPAHISAGFCFYEVFLLIIKEILDVNIGIFRICPD